MRVQTRNAYSLNERGSEWTKGGLPWVERRGGREATSVARDVKRKVSLFGNARGPSGGGGIRPGSGPGPNGFVGFFGQSG